MPVTELALLRLKAKDPSSSTKIEDPDSFYLLGGWESVEKHTGEGQWLSSEVNQNLLARYLASKIPLDAPVLAITRFSVEASKKDEFDSAFKATVPHLNKYTAPFSSCGAWRIDKEGADEEFVLFSGWNTVQDHVAFGQSEAAREFGKIKALMKGVDDKYVHVEKWE
ncbi:Dimeric alpha-beta barrel [Penicillium italicum]|uniref:Dimeric alpha-beta barrel n=1 Tax=Penicillium italicum TaxID=40296 RepID=A0A0A2KZW0_PENIT|nr:Dimeric alpha-beta barrel [Penicillium italicum]